MNSSTQGGYEKAVNKAVDYINSHLYESPDIKKLSAIAHLSEFHFHRIFKAIMGENVGEYIARLRLENIAQRLRMTKATLDKIALETGYATKHALSKAFKKHFGISPSSYRKLPQNVAFFDKKSDQSNILVEPEIRTVEAKKIVYVRIVDWYGSPDSYTKAWKKLGQFAILHSLINNTTEYIGLSFDDPTITKPEKCRFYACITTNKDIKPTGSFGVNTIEGGMYAVFLLKGSYSKLLDMYFNIYINWLPQSGYGLSNMYAFEKYLNNPNHVPEEKLLTEIYVPVYKKKI